MPVAWISYEWADNQYRDVDFVAQELQRVGLQVRLKQWDLSGSQPLREQVEPFVSQICQSNCWILIAAKGGLQQNAGNEELHAHSKGHTR